MPAKKSGKSRAAHEREASKPGETVSEQRQSAPSVQMDPTYIPSKSDDASSDSDNEILHTPAQASTEVDPETWREEVAKKRKARRIIADLIPDKLAKITRTTAWRIQNGKTKKARAVAMQPSVASLFKVVPSTSKQQKAQETRQEAEEGDSDIEMIDALPNQTPASAATITVLEEDSVSQHTEYGVL